MPEALHGRSRNFRGFVSEAYLPYASACKRSWRTDETLLRAHVMPVIGASYLDQIDPEAIAAVLNRMREQGYAIGTINRVLVLVRRLFNLARQWRTTGFANNPAADFRLGPEVDAHTLSQREEIERLIRALWRGPEQTAAQAILLLLMTGARRNEITYARWEYVDFAGQDPAGAVVQVRQAAHDRARARPIALLRSIARTYGKP